MCNECYVCLEKNNLPKYAMNNNLVIGKVPEQFVRLTIVEECCISRARILMNMIKLDNKGANGIRGNVITFPQNPDNILNVLPQIPNSTDFQILFSGKNKPTKLDLKKVLRFRRSIIQNCLLWLQKNNKFYADIIIDETLLNQLPENDIPDLLFDNIVFNEEVTYLTEETIGYDQIDRNNIEILDHSDLQSSGLLSVIDFTILTEKDKIELIQTKHLNSKILYIPHG